ncbi:hypothetical protein MHU86_21482 [Fragilaria crotonensis]|nr:hypothetical protein MHU86_21482 [Fragilaria crotonensis]
MITQSNACFMCDTEGIHQFILLEDIVRHGKDDPALENADVMYVQHGSNCQHMRGKTTRKGWKLSCVEWKDGGTTSFLERLADIKESNPVEVAEYAMPMG